MQEVKKQIQECFTQSKVHESKDGSLKFKVNYLGNLEIAFLHKLTKKCWFRIFRSGSGMTVIVGEVKVTQ